MATGLSTKLLDTQDFVECFQYFCPSKKIAGVRKVIKWGRNIAEKTARWFFIGFEWERNIAKKTAIWFFIGFGAPILLPMLGFFLATLLSQIGDGYLDYFIALYKKGYFLFLGVTLLLSLFIDYDHRTKYAFSPVVYFIVSFSIIVSVILLNSHMTLVQVEGRKSFEDNLEVHVVLTIFSIIFAMYYKYKVLLFKHEILKP